jgi:hypothetical protein
MNNFKKHSLTVLLLFCTVFAMQGQIKFGVKAGLNVAKPSLSKNLFDTKNMIGFQVGPTVDFTLPIVGLGFDASVLYSQQGMKAKGVFDILDGTVKEKTFRQHTIDIPVNLKYKFDFIVAGVYFTAGPYARFNIDDDFKDQWKSKSFGAGLNFGAGVELLKKVQLGATYQLGLTDDFSATYTDISGLDKKLKAKSRGWIISATYFF